MKMEVIDRYYCNNLKQKEDYRIYDLACTDKDLKDFLVENEIISLKTFKLFEQHLNEQGNCLMNGEEVVMRLNQLFTLCMVMDTMITTKITDLALTSKYGDIPVGFRDFARLILRELQIEINNILCEEVGL